MTNDYITRAKRFINEFVGFCGNEFDQTDYCITEQLVKRFNEKRRRHVILANGSVRLALLTSDYVIKWDYDEEAVCEYGGCEDELDFYNQIRDKAIVKYFAPIERYDVHGLTFYIMPRADMRKHKEGLVANWRLWCDSFDADWIEERLCDMHKGNWGFIGEQFTIVDYAMYERD